MSCLCWLRLRLSARPRRRAERVELVEQQRIHLTRARLSSPPPASCLAAFSTVEAFWKWQHAETPAAVLQIQCLAKHGGALSVRLQPSTLIQTLILGRFEARRVHSRSSTFPSCLAMRRQHLHLRAIVDVCFGLAPCFEKRPAALSRKGRSAFHPKTRPAPHKPDIHLLQRAKSSTNSQHSVRLNARVARDARCPRCFHLLCQRPLHARRPPVLDRSLANLR